MDAVSDRDPSVTTVLARLVDEQIRALGPALIGCCLFGSVVTGDFEPGISEIDTVAILSDDPTTADLTAFAHLHRDIVKCLPEWSDRVECVYTSSGALRSFRTARSPAARISPGEPFHAIELDPSWVLDWYPLRTLGETLWGPPPAALVPPITKNEYVGAVRRHLLEWRWTGGQAGRRSQSYAILSMCRGLRTVRTGDLVSKREAGSWGREVMLEHAELIGGALEWRAQPRAEPEADGEGTIDATLRFINDIQRMLG